MDPKLTREILRDRLNDSGGGNYLTLSSVLVGLDLAVAANSLTRFLTATAFPWDRLPLWIIGFENLILAYIAMTLLPIVAVFEPTWRDHILPLVIGLTNFLLFALMPNPDLVVLWYLIAALSAASHVETARHIALRLARSEYAIDVKSIAHDFGRSIRRVGWVSLGTGVCFPVVYLALPSNGTLGSWQWLFGVLGMVLMFIPILLLEQARHGLVKALG